MRTRRSWVAFVAVVCVARGALAQDKAPAPPPAPQPSGSGASPVVVAPPTGTAEATSDVSAPAPAREEPAPPVTRGSPPPMTAPPGFRVAEPGATELVPVWLAGADGEQAHVRIYHGMDDPSHTTPIAECTLPCGFEMYRGHYRIEVLETEHTLRGNRVVAVEGPSRLVITPRDRAKRTTGLVLGIGGIVAVVAGIGLIVEGVHSRTQCSTDIGCDRYTDVDSEAVAGLAVFVAGAALTPIGWVMFGRSFRPGIDVQEQPATPGTARLGVIGVPGGAGLGGTLVF